MLQTDSLVVPRETECRDGRKFIDVKPRVPTTWKHGGLLSGFLLVQRRAHGQGGVGIDGAVALFDELDDALLVDDDVGAQSPLEGIVVDVITLQNAVGFEHLLVHVAEEREGDAVLLGESGVGGRTIQTTSEDFRIRGVNLTGGDSSLDRLKLLRSTAGEGQDVYGKKDIFPATVVAELHGFPLVTEKREIGSGVSDFECHLGDL